ncbi:MAG: SCP2 sterol-binding domain-containing protein [Solirubrobacteraceae bacterium]
MIWFDRRSARGLTATLELRIRVLPRRRGTPVSLLIDDGRLRIRPGAAAAPGATATVALTDLLRLGVGAAAWPQLMANGRLTLSGDPFLALRFPSLFRLGLGNSASGCLRPTRKRRPALPRGLGAPPRFPPRARRPGSRRSGHRASG